MCLFVLSLVGATLQAAQIISSPEGTATKYVSDHGPLVYAPRAARAQKVVFDTPDKQLIYAPDTPFRRFFESHAADFEPDKLEYAKTTILGDIIAMLRSKAYVRDMVAAVIDDHKKTAISNLDPGFLLKSLSEVQKETSEVLSDWSAAYQNALLDQIHSYAPNGWEVEDSELLQNAAMELRHSSIVTNGINQLNTAIGNTFRAAAGYISSPQVPKLLVELQNLTNQIHSALFLPPTDWASYSNSYGKLLQASRTTSQAASHLRDTPAARTAKAAEEPQRSDIWRENHARLLTDALYLELIRQNYPDMENDKLEALLTKFTAISDLLQTKDDVTSSVWDYTTAQDLNQNLSPTRALALELTQRLKQRDWLRFVVDRAVAKRSELFKKSSSPIQGLRDTEDAFRKLTETKLFSPALAQCLSGDSVSLWQGFLNHVDSDPKSPSKRFLLQPFGNRERNMDADDLRLFARDLRQELLANGKSSDGNLDLPRLHQAITNYFGRAGKDGYLCPEFGSGTDVKQLENNARAFWSNHLRDDVLLGSNFGNLTNTLAGTNSPQVAVSNLLFQFQQVIHSANLLQSLDLRIESAALENDATNRASNFLKPYLDRSSKWDSLTLEILISRALVNTMPLSTSRALQRLISDFDTVFTGSLYMVASDDSLLKAFLASDQAKYGLPEFRAKAVAAIPARFYARAGTNDAGTNLVAIFRQVAEDPEIAYLFGAGSGNPQVVEAFKQEFCAAFQDRRRLQEAVTAEREADYDYWWLTFYPKAIPLGNKRLQGASIIEIGFPESIIPEAQYHRWLQDTSLQGGSKGRSKRGQGMRASASPKDNRNDYARFTGQPGEVITNLSLRNATTLLRDMLNVLEAVDLKAQFSEVRPMMIHALEKFTESEYQKIQEIDRYRNGILALYQDVFDEPISESQTPYEKLVWKEVEHYACAFKSKIGSENDSLSKMENQLRRKMRNLDFQKIHVLFSVYAVTRSKARLPEKVNLYLWAQARGAMLFLTEKEEFQKQQELSEHAISYYNLSEPVRDDNIHCLEEIPADHLASMQSEGRLYELILNSYFSSYPDVPSRKSIQEAYFNMDKEPLISVVYDWLDYSGVLYHTNRHTLLSHFAEDAAFLSENGRHLLWKSLEATRTNDSSGLTPAVTWYRYTLSNAVQKLFNEVEYQPLIRELDERLLDHHYKPLWETLAMIEETERHAVPYEQIEHGDYTRFRSWGRPKFQKGIQIAEMLPASRDDLVSMSVNEGGVIARLAGQADGSAAYDLNQAKMAQQYTSSASSQLNKLLSSRQTDLTNGLNTLSQALDETSSSRRQQVFHDLSQFGQSLTSEGYSLGATASGSVYGRARAALAYSRHREYLDAAITAAGRGDNFAKWVVRTSDLRSDLAAGAGKKLAAASHSGFPNGDQPFYLLVKVPRRAMQADWYGRQYIHFNSTYIATSRVSVWKEVGFAGLLAKAPLAILNPRWWTQIEEGLVGTQYPFMWDVHNEEKQNEMLRVPNTLGGSIWLDDTDKIKYSEIQERLAAEDNFIRLTREAQSRDLGTVMTEVQKESGQFRDEVRKQMSDRVKSMQKAQSEAEQSAGITNRIDKLESDIKELKSKYNSTGSSTNKSN